MSDKNNCGNKGVCCGAPVWFIGWLFTIGFIKVTFWKAVLALLVWPYFLGSALAAHLASAPQM